MKHKTNVGPGLIVALGAPSDSGGSATGKDNPSSLRSDAAASTDDPNALSEAGGSDAGDLDTVPLDVLSMPDDQEQMQPPEVGDVVNYQVTGKVVAIEGNEAKVQRQSINGQELPDANPDETSPDESGQDANGDDGSQSLRNDAAGIGMLS